MQQIDRIRAILDVIVCPACHGRLTFVATLLQCTACGRRYPVVDHILVLIDPQ